MASCNPSLPGCLKVTGPLGTRFCTACGLPSSELFGSSAGVGVSVSQPPPPPVDVTGQFAIPQYQPRPTSFKADLVSALAVHRENREPASLTSALMAAAGVLIGLAASAMVLESFSGEYDNNPEVGFMVGVGAMAVLWFASRGLPKQFLTALTTALHLVLPTTVIILSGDTAVEGRLGIPLLAIALALLAFWSTPGFRARPSLLGFALIYSIIGIGYLTAQSNLEVGDLFESLDDFKYFEIVAQETSIVIMLLGFLALVAAWNFDRRNWSNIATPFVVAGIYASTTGVVGLVASGDFSEVGAVLMLVALSTGILLVGGVSGRRATTWIGATYVTGGLISFAWWILSDDSSPVEFAVFALLIGGVVSVAAFKLGDVTTTKVKRAAPFSLK